MIHRYSSRVKGALILLLVSATLATSAAQTGEESPHESALKAQMQTSSEALLSDLLGQGNFQVHLIVNTNFFGRETNRYEPLASVIESEQIKREDLDKEDDNGYSHNVESRNYAVGHSKAKEVLKKTTVGSFQCVVLVKKDAWDKVDTAREPLAALLGFNPERGDVLTYSPY